MEIQTLKSYVKKIIMSKAEWLHIGKQAGWEDYEEKDFREENPGFHTFDYEFNDIEGEKFGQPGKNYTLKIQGSLYEKDDSDFNREYGYGKSSTITNFEIDSFETEEYDNYGIVLRDSNQIETETPELFKELFETASSLAKEKCQQG